MLVLRYLLSTGLLWLAKRLLGSFLPILRRLWRLIPF